MEALLTVSKEYKGALGDRQGHVVIMSVLLVCTDKVARLAEGAKRSGATCGPEGEEGGAGGLILKLLDSMKGSKAEKKEDKKVPKVVHLLRNQPPLPSKLVDMIQEGTFVDFAWFPVFDNGPSDGVEWKGILGESGESPSGSTSGRRKAIKEVPDLSGWSTCFTLLQVAWATKKPEMWVPLSAYREIIFKLAKRYQWAQVAAYDRRFRQEAAGKEEVKWDEENLSLVLDIVHATPQVKTEPRHGASAGGVLQKRAEQRRRGTCFRFNRGDGKCNFGVHCKFAHACSNCGGEHSMYRCDKPSEGK